jgi:UDP-N-acetylglucosamine--N-acetylmuramyl-(pentapeptide) pyrophosphoryl-undecaprenol N-acetylglucosamine transferase
MAQVQKTRIKVLIAAGGTGGHVYPGIAIAEELRAVDPTARILFAGTERGLESKILPKLGWPLLLLKSHSIKDRRGILKLIAWLFVPAAVLRALAILIAERPMLLVSIGGYAAGPLALAAWIMRVPTVLVEPNAVPGMTNRLLARFARRVFIAFEEASSHFAAGKVLLTGVPIRRQVLETMRLEGDADRTTIFIFGGSQGARRLNRAMVEALPLLADLAPRLRVLHQTGEADKSDEIARAYAQAGVGAQVFPFSDRIWECYSGADLVIARSGAGTVAEVAALGIPAILVPYPFAADDHQRANALALAASGGAIVLLDAECTGERLAAELRKLLSEPQRLREMAACAARAGHPDAAARIAEESLKLVKG